MASTRSTRFKFSEGERVLCYEPDPTKAKVLYDSKVLEVIESKSKCGRSTVEYLIHFQGWNSSWDRCVSEDFVLKDTEENRQLQRDLAEKSQLQLGAYLYRRERKKVSSSSSGQSGSKRLRRCFSEDGSSSSTHADEAEAVNTDSSSRCSSPEDDNYGCRAHIPLPSSLKDRLTFDRYMVVERGRLSRLPASPCVAVILESFVKWFARVGVWHPPQGRHDPPVIPDFLDISRRVNLVREVADGLRIYFDFILRGHLLYKQEKDQFYEYCGRYMSESELKSHTRWKEDTVSEQEDEESSSSDETDTTSGEEDLKRLQTQEHSHLLSYLVDQDKIQDADVPEKKSDLNEMITEKEVNVNTEKEVHVIPEKEVNVQTEKEVNVKSEKEVHLKTETELHVKTKMDADDNDTTKSISPIEDNTNHTEDSSKSREEISVTENVNVAQRFQSRKSAVSHSENEEHVPFTSGDQRTVETPSSSVGSCSSSTCESWFRPAYSAPAAPIRTRTPLSLLLDKVANFQLIPREGTENLPCRVYGAIHLARLFVKLPDFLNVADISDEKLQVVLENVDLFVQYLNEHSEWFGEIYYTSGGGSRSRSVTTVVD